MDDTVFTEEALKAQDGKKVPLRLEIGGPIIGEATLRYDSGRKILLTEFSIEDPKMTELFTFYGDSVVYWDCQRRFSHISAVKKKES
jgi:hypothetical protein